MLKRMGLERPLGDSKRPLRHSSSLDTIIISGDKGRESPFRKFGSLSARRVRTGLGSLSPTKPRGRNSPFKAQTISLGRNPQGFFLEDTGAIMDLDPGRNNAGRNELSTPTWQSAVVDQLIVDELEEQQLKETGSTRVRSPHVRWCTELEQPMPSPEFAVPTLRKHPWRTNKLKRARSFFKSLGEQRSIFSGARSTFKRSIQSSIDTQDSRNDIDERERVDYESRDAAPLPIPEIREFIHPALHGALEPKLQTYNFFELLPGYQMRILQDALRQVTIEELQSRPRRRIELKHIFQPSLLPFIEDELGANSFFDFGREHQKTILEKALNERDLNVARHRSYSMDPVDFLSPSLVSIVEQVLYGTDFFEWSPEEQLKLIRYALTELAKQREIVGARQSRDLGTIEASNANILPNGSDSLKECLFAGMDTTAAVNQRPLRDSMFSSTGCSSSDAEEYRRKHCSVRVDQKQGADAIREPHGLFENLDDVAAAESGDEAIAGSQSETTSQLSTLPFVEVSSGSFCNPTPGTNVGYCRSARPKQYIQWDDQRLNGNSISSRSSRRSHHSILEPSQEEFRQKGSLGPAMRSLRGEHSQKVLAYDEERGRPRARKSSPSVD